MQNEITALLNLLHNGSLSGTKVMQAAAPIAFFGDITNATLATIALNPSDKEFGPNSKGPFVYYTTFNRRVHHMGSLGLANWSLAGSTQVTNIYDDCIGYFGRRPYMQWFSVLERLLVKAGYSYSKPYHKVACSLDLVPFATQPTWNGLSNSEKEYLYRLSKPILQNILLKSKIETIFLNGQQTVDQFNIYFGTALNSSEIPYLSTKGKPRTLKVYQGWLLIGTRNYKICGVNLYLQYTGSDAVLNLIKTYI